MIVYSWLASLRAPELRPVGDCVIFTHCQTVVAADTISTVYVIKLYINDPGLADTFTAAAGNTFMLINSDLQR